MASSESPGKVKYPQDLVAIFHASFHPTQGNVIDWFLTASDNLKFRNLEFSALPSGLHLVEQDVVYFSRDSHHGVCVYRRRPTAELGRRGFHLSSLGVLLAKSARPRPWKHVLALKELSAILYSQFDRNDILEPKESDWAPAAAFFNERKIQRADLSGAGDWNGWSKELDESHRPDPGVLDAMPTLHLSHLLRILGPSSLTLYKHVLGRRRILIYTLPPVEPACILCHVAADMCFEVQQDPLNADEEGLPRDGEPQRPKGRCREAINILGLVTLNDTDRMKEDGKNGRGWIACTTDAIFLEKPSYYDLLIDLTTSTPSKATRPTFYISRPVHNAPTGGKGATHRLSVTRFVWSDIKLWNELDRILRLDISEGETSCCNMPTDLNGKPKLISAWTDVWRIYEDVCLICAGLWMGTWRSNQSMPHSTSDGSLSNWGRIQLEGDDDLAVEGSYTRNLGMGLEGLPSPSATGNLNSNTSSGCSTPSKKSRRSIRSSHLTRKATASKATLDAREVDNSTVFNSSDVPLEQLPLDPEARRDRHIRTTLALVQTFHTNTCFQLSRVQAILARHNNGADSGESVEGIVYLAPRDVLSFELGPLSSFDARYLEWLFAEYARGTKVVVKRGWRDLFDLVIPGYG